MKSYTLAAAVALAVSGGLVFAVLKSFGSASRAASELASERTTVANDRMQLEATTNAVNSAIRRMAGADDFLTKWTAELNAESSIEDIFGRLDTLAVDNVLSPSGKNFKLNSNYYFNGHHLQVQNVNINVAGDYYRTLNWLGLAEAAFPLARVEQVTYTNVGSSLSVAVQFSFPVRFEQK